MRNVAFFITHKTLGIDHAEMTLASLGLQQTDKQLDVLYLYNTHEDELDNKALVALCLKHGVDRIVKEIKIFPYDNQTHKALAADIFVITEYCRATYAEQDRILLLKSDIVLSVNYLDDILSLPEGDVYFVAPFVCAKARVTDAAILEYAKRHEFIRSDDITFFVEDEHNSPANDFNDRDGVDVMDEDILFTSCTVNTDFSCHFITNWLTRRLNLQVQSWGGVKFHALLNYYTTTNRSFAIHKYHGIESENRTGDREGPVKDWLNS